MRLEMSKRNRHPIEELELMAYLDGELPRERAAAAAAHLEDCTECQTLAADLRGVSQDLAAWQIESLDLKVPPKVSALLEVHVRTQEEMPVRRGRRGLALFRNRRVWEWGLGSVGVVLLIAIAIPNLMRSKHAAMQVRTGREQQAAEARRGPSYDSVPENKEPQAPSADGSVAGRTGDGTTARVPASQQPKGWIGNLAIPTGPMVIRTGELTLITTDFSQARSRLDEILRHHAGYLGNLSVSGSAESGRTLTATLRVPADQLDSAISELKKLGRVESESQAGEEVSQQYVDLQARIANARNAEQRLTDILQHRTGALSDVLEVEQTIEGVRENIERMEAEKKSMEKQAAFATLNMRVTEDYKQQVHVVPESTSMRIRNAAVDGYETMVAGLISLLLFLFSAGPSLLLWGAIVFFPARLLWKKWQARNRI